MQELENCGFLGWIDPKWHGGLQNALVKLWAMCEDSENRLSRNNQQNATLLHNMSEQNKEMEKKYSNLLQDMDKWMDDTYQKIKNDRMEEDKLLKVKAET